MKVRTFVIAFGFLIGFHQTANAACTYQGVSYAVGSKLCFGGWLQECTVANYWKAIGMCRAPDSRTPIGTTPATLRNDAPALKADKSAKVALNSGQGR